MTIIFAIIAILIGIRLMKVYSKQKKFEYFTLGLTMIIFTIPWWPGFLMYFSVLIFDQVLNIYVNIFLQNALVPLAIICWIYSFSILNYGEDGNKKLVLFYVIIGILYDIIFLIILFYDPYIIVYNIDINGISVGRNLLFMIFPIFVISSALVTGGIFARKSMKIDDKKIKLRGIFVFLAFLLFFIGAMLDAGIVPDPSFIIFKRIILLSSAVFYYLAFFIPNWLVKKLAK